MQVEEIFIFSYWLSSADISTVEIRTWESKETEKPSYYSNFYAKKLIMCT